MLTGGLGNQLFQFAAALNFHSDNDFILEVELGKPRSWKKGIPDLYGFNVDKIAQHKKSKTSSWLPSKTMGYLLRSGYLPGKLELNKFVQSLICFAASIVMSVTYLKLLRARSPRDLGYDKDFSLPDGSYVVNGYFQSWRYPFDSQVRSKLRMLELNNPTLEIINFRKVAAKELPLVVHVRLGDYKNETNFGIPSKSYYENAIEQCWATGSYSSIWLFSDAPEEAITKIPTKFRSLIRVIELLEESPAATMEVFRMGHGYVLANSSFSWWGAYLSHTHNPIVITPTPWFRSGANPKDLIPSMWKTLPAGI